LALAAFSAHAALAQPPPAQQPMPQALQAQPPPSPELSGVDVFSAKDDPVDSFVKSFAAPTQIGQLANWRVTEGICPQVFGVDAASGAEVVQRIRAVAAMVGAPVKKEPCEGNIMIMVTLHAQAQLDQILATQPPRFGPLMPGAAKISATMKYPIQAWYATETVDNRGRVMMDNTDVGKPLIELNRGLIRLGSIDGSLDGKAGSLLSEGLESHFGSLLIVVDGTKVVFDPKGAVSDYLAMVSLAQTKNFGQCHALSSITNFTGSCDPASVPKQLTDTDLAYLRGLYALRMTDKAAFQTVEIAKRIKKDSPH
jgi:hypothetical protein